MENRADPSGVKGLFSIRGFGNSIPTPMNSTILVTAVLTQGLEYALKLDIEDHRLPRVIDALANIDQESFRRWLASELRGATRDYQVKVIAARLSDYWNAVNRLTDDPVDCSPAPCFFYEALEAIKIEHVAVLENLADASKSFDSICNA